MKGRVLLVAAFVAAGGQAQQSIGASNSRPFILYFTHDDGPAAPPPTLFPPSESSTVKMARTHLQTGVPATFFHLGCKLLTTGGQAPAPTGSWCSAGWVDNAWVHDVEVALVRAGFILGNHSVDHIPLPWIEKNAGAIAEEVYTNETILNAVRFTGDVRLFREPGFAGDSAVGVQIAADPRSAGLYWPIGADIVDVSICSNNSPDPQVPWSQGVDPIACGHLMSAQINARCTVSSGCIVLVHEQDGNNFGDIELKQILSDLGMDQPGSAYRADHVTGIPGLLPPTHLGLLQTLTSSFGDDDGMGQPLVGRPVASSLPSVCKLRSSATVWCAVPGQNQGAATLPLQAPSPWLTIGDSGFTGDLWLADVNGDGLDDLVYLTPQGVWAALSNGRDAFLQPTLWFPSYLYQQFGTPQAIRFGRLYSSSPGKDLLMAFAKQSSAILFNNYGAGFGALFAREIALPSTADLSTLRLADLNGDGLDDLVIRDSINGQILAALANPDGFGAFDKWMDFAGQTNLTGWNDPSNGSTLHVASFGGKTMLTVGTSTGIIFSEARFDAASGQGQFSRAWRHLCNQCLTDNLVPSWHPEWQASGLVWLGNAAVFTRSSGLEIAFGQIDN